MAAVDFTFYEKTHRYSYKGADVASVTQIISRMSDFSGISPKVLDNARRRGTLVHLACHMWDCGILDEDSVDVRLVPYVSAWKDFCAERSPLWEMVEMPLMHEAMMYAGTPDRVGIIGDKMCVVDIKCTSDISSVVGIQLAGYKILVEENAGAPIDSCMAVQLLPNGKYKTRAFDDERHTSAFYALHALAAWEREFK